MPKGLIEVINKMDIFTNTIKINQFDQDQHTAQQDHFSNTQQDNKEYQASMNNSEHESNGELDNSQQIDDMYSDTRFPEKNEIL